MSPLNKRLYNQVKEEAKKRFKKWPSAYASGWLVQEYKRRGGKYRGKKSPSTRLQRWFEEEWIDVCHLPKKVPCGRTTTPRDWKKEYPYCRPSRRVNSRSPKPYTEFTKTELKRRCNKKRRSPMKRLSRDRKRSK
jgi:hypothetical protein